MLQAMRDGTFEVPPLPQSAVPGPDWHVAPEGAKRSRGAQGVSNPDDPGGFGDASGKKMIERLIADAAPIEARPTHERLIVDGAALLDAPGPNGSAH